MRKPHGWMSTCGRRKRADLAELFFGQLAAPQDGFPARYDCNLRRMPVANWRFSPLSLIFRAFWPFARRPEAARLGIRRRRRIQDLRIHAGNRFRLRGQCHRLRGIANRGLWVGGQDQAAKRSKFASADRAGVPLAKRPRPLRIGPVATGPASGSAQRKPGGRSPSIVFRHSATASASFPLCAKHRRKKVGTRQAGPAGFPA